MLCFSIPKDSVFGKGLIECSGNLKGKMDLFDKGQVRENKDRIWSWFVRIKEWRAIILPATLFTYNSFNSWFNSCTISVGSCCVSTKPSGVKRPTTSLSLFNLLLAPFASSSSRRECKSSRRLAGLRSVAQSELNFWDRDKYCRYRQLPRCGSGNHVMDQWSSC